MIRKFLLVAGLTLLEGGGTTQLLVAQLICFGYIVFLLNYSPYMKDDADFTNQARPSVPACCLPLGVCLAASPSP